MVTPELKWPTTNFTPSADELVGDRDAFARIGAVVADVELDLLAEDAALGVDVGDRLLDALAQLRAEGGGAAGHRPADADPDLRRGGVGKRKPQAERKAQRQKLLHDRLPLRNP